MESINVVIIGSGNVATHLAQAIDKCHHVVQVYSRMKDNAKDLSNKLKSCTYTDNLSDIVKDADFYLISVSDDAISDIARYFYDVDGIVAHTSGSVGIEALGAAGSARGVFYPLQTFSKKAVVKISEAPFFIEGSDKYCETRLKDLAETISHNVHLADSVQRQSLHVAAVFACNFFNHMLCISSRILNAEGYELKVLRPLLEATLEKAMTIAPQQAQTGPAARRDNSTIDKHMSRLDGYDKEIYSLITKAIIAEAQRSNI